MTSPEDPFRSPDDDRPREQERQPGPTGFGAPPGQYGAPSAPPRNGLGTAALVLGLLSIPLAFFYIGLVLAVLAIVFGVIGRGRARRGEATNGGVATGGLATGVIGLLISIAVIAGTVALFNSEEFSDLTDCLSSAQTTAEQDACAQQFGDSVTG